MWICCSSRSAGSRPPGSAAKGSASGFPSSRPSPPRMTRTSAPARGPGAGSRWRSTFPGGQRPLAKARGDEPPPGEAVLRLVVPDELLLALEPAQQHRLAVHLGGKVQQQRCDALQLEAMLG